MLMLMLMLMLLVLVLVLLLLLLVLLLSVDAITRVDGLMLGAEGFLRQSVSVAVCAAYDRKFESFRIFVADPRIGLTDPYLSELPSMMMKISVLILFCQALFNGGQRGQQVSDFLAAIQWKFGTKGIDTACFEHDIMKYRVRRASRRSLAESRALAAVASIRLKSPIPEEVLIDVWDLYWISQTWSWDGSYLKCVGLGILYGYLSGRRIGNFTLNSKGERDSGHGRDHNLLRSCVSFGLMNGSWIVSTDVILLASLSEGDVFAVKWTESTKTSDSGSYAMSEPFVIYKHDGCWEARLVAAMLEFAVHACRNPINKGETLETYFFAVNRLKVLQNRSEVWRKNLTRRDTIEKLQSVCCTLGIPPGLISARSFRITYATLKEAYFKFGSRIDRVLDPLRNWAGGSRMQVDRYSRCKHLMEDDVRVVAAVGHLSIDQLRKIWSSMGVGGTSNVAALVRSDTVIGRGGVPTRTNMAVEDGDSSDDEGVYAGVVAELDSIAEIYRRQVVSASV